MTDAETHTCACCTTVVDEYPQHWLELEVPTKGADDTYYLFCCIRCLRLWAEKRS